MGSEQVLRGTPHPIFGKLAFYGLILAQTLTLAAFLVVLGSLSQLQKTANGLALDEATQAVYADVFQSAHQIPYPLPGGGPRQFAIQWYLLFFELAVFLVILPLLGFPRHLIRFKTALIAFLTYFFALVTLQVESILYFTRNPAANLVFGEKPLKAALAGVILVTIANPLSIIFLGLLHEDNFPERGHSHVATPGTKRVSDGDSSVARV